MEKLQLKNKFERRTVVSIASRLQLLRDKINAHKNEKKVRNFDNFLICMILKINFSGLATRSLAFVSKSPERKYEQFPRSGKT